MSESCDVNGICSRFGYDEYGRQRHQWDNQVSGSAWPADAAATVRWGYSKPGTLGTNHTTYIVTEWRVLQHRKTGPKPMVEFGQKGGPG